MRDISTANRYNIIFETGIDFFYRVGISEEGQFEGCSDEEIATFCKNTGISLPPCVWSYSRSFGKKSGLSLSELNCAYTLSDMEFAHLQAKAKDEWLGNKNMKEILEENNFKINYDIESPLDNVGLYTPEICSVMDIQNVQPFFYDSYDRSFKFFDSQEENPIIYYFRNYRSLNSNFTTLTNSFRRIIFLFILKYAPLGFAQVGRVAGKQKAISEPSHIDYSDDYAWVKEYEEMTRNISLMKQKELQRLREWFYVVNDEKEKREDRILSINEFERDFLKFIKEEQHSTEFRTL